MCRPKEQGGRRCPNRGGQKRLAVAAVETESVPDSASRRGRWEWIERQSATALAYLSEAWSGIDEDYASVLVRASAVASTDDTPTYRGAMLPGGDIPEAAPRSADRPISKVLTNDPGHWANQTIETVDGSQYPWPPDPRERARWVEVMQVDLTDPDGPEAREVVGLACRKWGDEILAYHSVQNQQGMWETQGRIAFDANQAARVLTPDQRDSLGLPMDPPVRPTVDELVEMFPPHIGALKAAWGHDEAYQAELDGAEFLIALGDRGEDFARMQTGRGGTPSAWVDNAGHNATPLQGRLYAQHFGDYGDGAVINATDEAGAPVAWDPESVKAWNDRDAAGHTGWRPVAMIKPKRKSIERREKRARTFYDVQRRDAYGIAHNQTTGEWAVYNTVDTSTSKNWAHGRDCKFETAVVISSDINKAAAHLSVQQREALGLPGTPVGNTAVGDTTDRGKVA